MYLKRAPASSGRAVLQCGMSWGTSAAGGSPTTATLSLFSELQVKLFFWCNKTHFAKKNIKKIDLVKMVALEILLQNQLSSIMIFECFLLKEEFIKLILCVKIFITKTMR